MMKNKFFAIAIGLLTVSSLKAQDFRFGFQVSPSWSWIQTDVPYVNPNGTVLGMKLGAIGEYYFRENYAITGGLGFFFNTGGKLLYDHGGRIWTRSELDSTVDTVPAGANFKYNLQFVEIPMGLKMRTREFGYMRYFAELPIITLGFKSQARGTIQAQGIPETEKYNIKREVNTLALSWGLGGGIEYSLSQNTALVGGLYYQQVFTDVTDDNGTIFHSQRGNISNNSKGTIGSITVRLGIIF